MRKLLILSVLAVAACESYGTPGTPWGDYQTARERVLTENGVPSATVPMGHPVQSPTPEMIAPMPRQKATPAAPVVVAVTPGAPLTASGKAVYRGSSGLPRYAADSGHLVGTQVYPRDAALTENAQILAAQRCKRYYSTNAAQLAFLAQGGPQVDRLGLDPDGDGYVCGWDPSEWRKPGQ